MIQGHIHLAWEFQHGAAAGQECFSPKTGEWGSARRRGGLVTEELIDFRVLHISISRNSGPSFAWPGKSNRRDAGCRIRRSWLLALQNMGLQINIALVHRSTVLVELS